MAIISDRYNIIDHSYTQRLSGLLPKVKDGDSTKWIVEEGRGIIVNRRSDPLNPQVFKFKFLEKEFDIPSELNGTERSVYASIQNVEGTATVVIQPSAFTADELSDRITLGAILSSDGTNIDSISPISLPDEGETKALLNSGAKNITQSFPSPIAGTMQLSFPASTFKFPGRNGFNDPNLPHTKTYAAQSVISYIQVYPDGTSEPNFTNIFNCNNYYDLNSNQITAAMPTFWTIQFLYRFPSGLFASVLGIEQYETMALALSLWDAVESNIQPKSFKDASKFICAIAGMAGAVDISDRTQVIIAPKREI